MERGTEMDEYEGILLPGEGRRFTFGDKVPLLDGIYLGKEGGVLVYGGIFLAIVDKERVYDEYGNNVNLRVLNESRWALMSREERISWEFVLENFRGLHGPREDSEEGWEDGSPSG